MQSPGPFPDVVEIVVEIPRGSRNKYEYDEVAGVYRLDRVLSSAVFYNFDYGFIEGTRAGDGDHTDALLIIDEPTFTGCHVWARPIGGLEMRDEKGFDFKVLCVALGDAHQQHITKLKQVRPHRLVEIEHFFQTYKALEDKTVDDDRLARARPSPRGPASGPGDLGTRDRPDRGVVTGTPPGAAPRGPDRPRRATAALARARVNRDGACSSPRPCPTTRPRRSPHSSTASGRVVSRVAVATCVGSGWTGST